jgi:hypothetical protein
LILAHALSFTRAEPFRPQSDRLQSRSQGIVERRGFPRFDPAKET